MRLSNCSIIAAAVLWVSGAMAQEAPLKTGDLKQALDSKLNTSGGQITGPLTIGGSVQINGPLTLRGGIQMFTPARKFPDWIPVQEGDSKTEVAGEDGFLSVTVKALVRDNTVCFVEGNVDGTLMGAASVTGVTRQNFPDWENSFMTPVYKGARWEVIFHQDPYPVARASPIVYLRWTPLGSVPGPDAEAWQIVRGSNSAELFEQFLKEYPNSQYAGAARLKLAALRRASPR